MDYVEQQMDKREMSEKYQTALLAAITDDPGFEIKQTMPIEAVGQLKAVGNE